MDKVRVYLEVLKKHHFWVLCAIVLVAGFLAQSKGKSFFAEQYTSNKGQIESAAGSVERVSRDSTQPNEKFTEAVKEEHAKLNVSVEKLWTDLYQNQETVLEWPSWVRKDENWPQQILAVAERKPGRTLKPGEGLPDNVLRTYLELIHQEFDPLFDVLNLRREVGEGKESGFEGLVVVDPALVKRIGDQYDWSQPPDEHKVLYAQEDLWVYRALFEIISKVNGDASDHIYAPIKAIEKLAIAQAAAAPPESSIVLPETMKPKSYPEAPSVPSADSTGEEILDGRYVDEEGKPLNGTARPPFEEFNLIPVQLVVLIDQHNIDDLLAECANSSVPFSVRRVRINPPNSTYHRAMPDPDPAKNKKNEDKTDKSQALEPGYYDIPVEIHGVVFLRKPPDVTTEEDAVAAAG